MSDEHVQCRRCDDCKGQDHHWLAELIMDPRLSPIEDPVADHVCKHCPVVGMTCEACDGDGVVVSETWMGGDEECRSCRGHGIKIVPGVVVVEDEDGTPIVTGLEES